MNIRSASLAGCRADPRAASLVRPGSVRHRPSSRSAEGRRRAFGLGTLISRRGPVPQVATERNTASTRRVITDGRSTCFGPAPRARPARRAVHVGIVEGCYLVDPASSHMLVSKIKPCMCKYELIQTVKLRMAH